MATRWDETLVSAANRVTSPTAQVPKLFGPIYATASTNCSRPRQCRTHPAFRGNPSVSVVNEPDARNGAQQPRAHSDDAHRTATHIAGLSRQHITDAPRELLQHDPGPDLRGRLFRRNPSNHVPYHRGQHATISSNSIASALRSSGSRSGRPPRRVPHRHRVGRHARRRPTRRPPGHGTRQASTDSAAGRRRGRLHPLRPPGRQPHVHARQPPASALGPQLRSAGNTSPGWSTFEPALPAHISTGLDSSWSPPPRRHAAAGRAARARVVVALSRSASNQ